jgi:4-carboxymuconolactone decarboxylase
MSEYQARLKRGHALAKKMGRENHMLRQKAICPAIYELSIGHLFGDIWTRPHLSLREREMITLAANIALGRQIGIRGHFESALHIGITKDQIMELIIQVGHYAGWPTMAHAVAQYAEMEEEQGPAKKKKSAARPRAK